jgi:hypothetical protein
MLLVPFLWELIGYVVLIALIWPISPLAATLFGFPKFGMWINVVVSAIFSYIAYMAFLVSTKEHHLNVAGEIIPSFVWLFTSAAAMIAVCWAATIWKLQRTLVDKH